MALKFFKQFNSKTPDLNAVQDNVSEIYTVLMRNQMLDGIILSGIFLKSGQSNLIETKLSREIQGWLIVDKNANANVWRNASTNSKFINLLTSLDVTVSIYVF